MTLASRFFLIKKIVSVLFVVLTANIYAQTNYERSRKEITTSKYGGIYSFGSDVKKGSVGQFTIYPESDSTILFYVDICRGAPSYNLGSLYRRLKIKNGEAIYYSNEFGGKGCKWRIQIKDDTLTVTTLDNCFDCGFGANVIADNQYTRKDSSKPEFFINGEGNKIFFNKTTPENYYK